MLYQNYLKEFWSTAVLGGNYSSTEQVNSIQQLLAYSLITGTEVDIREIIYSDLVTKLLNKSRLKYISYPRFVSCALQVLLGCDYTQDENFGFLPGILMSPLPLAAKPKKGKSRTVTPTLPKSQGPEVPGALSKKSKRPKSKKPPTETKVTPPKPMEGSEQSHSVSSGTVPDPQDLERDIQLANSRGNIQPLERDLTSMTSDKGTAKTTLCPEGSLRDKYSKGNIPPANIEPINPTDADL
ncbi:hypothetical protein Tco_0022218, partial [Tanacetum coccineum]